MGKPTRNVDWLHRAPHASGLDRIEAYFAGFAFDPQVYMLRQKLAQAGANNCMVIHNADLDH